MKAIEITQTSKYYGGIFKSSSLLQSWCWRDPRKSSPAAKAVRAKWPSPLGCWLPGAAGQWWQEVEATWATTWDVPSLARELLWCCLMSGSLNGKFQAERIFSGYVGVAMCNALIVKDSSSGFLIKTFMEKPFRTRSCGKRSLHA